MTMLTIVVGVSIVSLSRLSITLIWKLSPYVRVMNERL